MCGMLSALSGSTGLVALLDGVLKASNIRDAVYARANEITPENIEQANKLILDEWINGYYILSISALGCWFKRCSCLHQCKKSK